jgi:hypothetical protein
MLEEAGTLGIQPLACSSKAPPPAGSVVDEAQERFSMRAKPGSGMRVLLLLPTVFFLGAAIAAAGRRLFRDRPFSPPAPAEEQRRLYLTPGGRYTAADIRANGDTLPAEKFKGVLANHHLHPAVGDRICPITDTRANPRFAWIIGGRRYLFCCPPCIDEFVQRAKTAPGSIRLPEVYVQR